MNARRSLRRSNESIGKWILFDARNTLREFEVLSRSASPIAGVQVRCMVCALQLTFDPNGQPCGIRSGSGDDCKCPV
jgi:hypothetical protein